MIAQITSIISKRWLQAIVLAVLGLIVLEALQFDVAARTVSRDSHSSSGPDEISGLDWAASTELIARVVVTEVHPILFNTVGGGTANPEDYEDDHGHYEAQGKNRLVALEVIEYLYPPSPPDTDGFVAVEWKGTARHNVYLDEVGWLGVADEGSEGIVFASCGTNSPPGSRTPARVRAIDEAAALSTGAVEYEPCSVHAWYWFEGADAVSHWDDLTASQSQLLDEIAAGIALR